MKRYFLVRLLNIAIIVALVFSYQFISVDRAKEEAKAKEAAQKRAAEELAASGYESPYNDGDFIASAEGYGGAVEMKVTIKDGMISNIEKVSAPGEDAAYWDMAKDMIPEMVTEQDPNVDTVSGATLTSIGIRNAVIEALKKALK